MCRMLAFAAQTPCHLDDVLDGGFRSFAELSKIHKDGWGTAEVGGPGAIRSRKAPTTAFGDPAFWEATRAIESRSALVHLRWGTGTELAPRNTHPFVVDGTAFVHNGLVRNTKPLEALIPQGLMAERRGETDSEVYFLALLSLWRESGDLTRATETVVGIIRDECGFSGINFLMLTSDHLYAFMGFDPSAEIVKEDADYYELHLLERKEGLVVASSGWAADEWRALENGDLVSVDLAGPRFEIHHIAGLPA